MKLEKVRELYLGLKLTSEGATDYLCALGMSSEASEDLLSLWVNDEWARSEKAKAETVVRGPTGHVTYKGRQYKVTLEEE